MSLVDALDQATAGLKALADQLQALAATPIRVELGGGGASTDRADAEAIKRGQRPETLAAMRKALNL